MPSFLKDGCPPEWWEILKEEISQIKVKKGDKVFEANSVFEGIYEIKKGKFKIIDTDVEGNELVIRLAGNGEIIGHRGIGGNEIQRVSAVALEDSHLIFLPKKWIEVLGRTNPHFSYKLMLFLASELRDTEVRILHLPVLNRVSYALYKNYLVFGVDKRSKKLNYALSRQDISSFAITTYESTIRSLADLKKQGVIDTKVKDIFIKDPKKLKALASY